MDRIGSTSRAFMRLLVPFALPGLLGGCNMVVMNPAGDVARQQADLIVISTVLMLLVIVPVMALTIWFAWRYRQANKAARYEPEWDHSTRLELVIWAAPLLIIIMLGAVTWVGTHLLDPYRPIGRVAPGKAMTAAAKPLEVNVVALDWKWLFIYPEYGIATVNELAAPVDRPIHFRITASSVMNSFYIPALAGQIYAMPGMETKLHAVINKPGNYEGFSANYSGSGFSHMRFRMLGATESGFAQWVEKARARGAALGRQGYLTLERPSEKVPVMRFASVEADLYDRIVNMCVEPGKMCMGNMMAVDAGGGMGLAGVHNVNALAYDKHGARGTGHAAKTFVAETCTLPKPLPRAKDGPATPVDQTRLTGMGLPRPDRAQLADGRAATPRS